ncbi:MAG: hypothetical protein ABIO45_00440 [Burkholderiaceae bacterium]
MVILIAALATPLATAARPSRFDGAWSVTLSGPAHDAEDDDAKGSTHRFTAEVIEGQLRGAHRSEGEPGWHFLHGRIRKDG